MDPAPSLQASVSAIESLPAVLAEMRRQITAVLEHLRESSGALQHESVSKLQLTLEQLQKASTTTESAAHGILDGIDRSLTLVGELDTLDGSGNTVAAEKRAHLKEHLFDAMRGVQFQDVTSQQLRHASSLINDMEQRFGSLVKALDPESIHQLTADLATREAHFDPDATFSDRERRQADADGVFQR